MHKQELTALLEPTDQLQVLRFWEELDESQRENLARQIAAVDLDLVTRLYEGGGTDHDWAELARRAEPPKALRCVDRQPTNSSAQGPFGWSVDDARKRGEAALTEGKVGVLIVAGGQGSRLGFDHPKGMYPIGPVSGASLLQIHFEKALATARRFGADVPIYLMSSPATHDEQIEYLADNERFGLAEDQVMVFCQGTMPAVDAKTGKLLLAEQDQLFLSPDGHGGTVAALANSGAFEHMRRQGVEYLFYLQVDNPLIPICDPEFIGHHILAKSEMTSIAVGKQEALDKVGNFVSVEGRVQVIEYSDFPNDVAHKLADDGSLKFWAGSIAIHLFDVAFLESSHGNQDALPFHIARKKVPFLNSAGKLVEPSEPNALKFERFIFDLLPEAKNALVVEYAEEDCFAPLKNAPGAPKDTEEYVQRYMVNQHCQWLETAGAEVADGIEVEISPLWALDAEAVTARLEPGTSIDEAIYLCE